MYIKEVIKSCRKISIKVLTLFSLHLLILAGYSRCIKGGIKLKYSECNK